MGDCGKSCPQVCPSGEPWPSGLDLAPASLSGNNGLRPPFVTDQESWDALEAAASRVAAIGQKPEVWATVRGYLVVRSNSSVGPCDLVANAMFGALNARGWHGGQLIVEGIRDVEI